MAAACRRVWGVTFFGVSDGQVRRAVAICGSEREFDEVPYWRGFQDFSGLRLRSGVLATAACRLRSARWGVKAEASPG
jgi:hypothetical protein